MKRFIKCINASLIIRQNEKRRDNNDDAHQLWEKKFRKPEKNSSKFKNFVELFAL